MAFANEATVVRTTSTSVSSETIAVSVGSLTGRAVMVYAVNFNGTAGTTVTGVTYNGVSLGASLATTTNSFSRVAYLFCGLVADGAVATPNVVVSFSAANATWQIFTASFSGIASIRGGAAQSWNNGVGTSTTPTTVITTASGDEVRALGFDGQFNGNTFTATGGTTLIASEATSGNAWETGITASGASTTMSGSFGVGSVWNQGAVAFTPAVPPPPAVGPPFVNRGALQAVFLRF